MTLTVRAHFDGTALIPDEPLDLPVGEPLKVTVEPVPRPERVPILADPDRTTVAALRELFESGVAGVDLPAEALRRENMYGDEGR